jgi:hypothetical protein
MQFWLLKGGKELVGGWAAGIECAKILVLLLPLLVFMPVLAPNSITGCCRSGIIVNIAMPPAAA